MLSSDLTNLLRIWQVGYCRLMSSLLLVYSTHKNCHFICLYPLTVQTENLIKHACACGVEFATGPTTPTCRNCENGNCENNLLPELLQQGLLTSGYFSILSSKKPAGTFFNELSAFCFVSLVV